MKPQVFDRLNEHLFAQLLPQTRAWLLSGSTCGQTLWNGGAAHVGNGSIGRPGNLVVTVIGPMITPRFFLFFFFCFFCNFRRLTPSTDDGDICAKHCRFYPTLNFELCFSTWLPRVLQMTNHCSWPGFNNPPYSSAPLLFLEPLFIIMGP